MTPVSEHAQSDVTMETAVTSLSEIELHVKTSKRFAIVDAAFCPGNAQCADSDVTGADNDVTAASNASSSGRFLDKMCNFMHAATGVVLRLLLCVWCLPAASYCAWVDMTSQDNCQTDRPRGRSTKIDPASAFLDQ